MHDDSGTLRRFFKVKPTYSLDDVTVQDVTSGLC